MSELFERVTTEDFQGLPCIRLHHASGDSARVALHGGQVLSWTAGAVERLYLSPTAVLDGQAAIRGGVPICFPQFNQRGPLPKHGFARNLPWIAGAVQQDDATGDTVQVFSLSSGAASLALWPHDFVARLAVRLGAGRLQLDFSVQNTGAAALAFTTALHTYFRVAAIGEVRLDGLQGQPLWDAVSDRHAGQPAGAIRFTDEFDRVYQAAAGALLLGDRQQRLRIEQSPTLGQTVVWNPGAARCATLSDMPADGYQQMVCVEAAQVDAPVRVPAGGQWSGWQRLSLAG